MLAVGRDGQVVGVEAGQVSRSDAIAVEIEGLPPAGLDVPLVAAGALEHDESIAQCADSDRAPVELDFSEQGELSLGFDVVDQQAIVARAGARPAGCRPRRNATRSTRCCPVAVRSVSRSVHGPAFASIGWLACR